MTERNQGQAVKFEHFLNSAGQTKPRAVIALALTAIFSIQLTCADLNNYPKTHPGDTTGACEATPTTHK